MEVLEFHFQHGKWNSNTVVVEWDQSGESVKESGFLRINS